jgi:transcription elongation factor GreA
VATDGQLALDNALTRDGLESLRAELAELTAVSRTASRRRVQAAYESGGEIELADALREQDRLELRIRRLEDRLLTARIVTDDELDDDHIGIGHRVDVRRGDGGERSYVLVGPAESDPRRGRLSSDSPLGRALAGRRAGEVVELEHNGERVTVIGFGIP